MILLLIIIFTIFHYHGYKAASRIHNDMKHRLLYGGVYTSFMTAVIALAMVIVGISL
jgi:cell division protein FtsW (lipid II flippase)